MIDSTRSYIALRMEIPFGDTEIPDMAFPYSGQLYEINLPIATKIGKRSFIGCDKIPYIELPRVVSIGDSAFQSCTGITLVDAPKAKSIGEKAFAGCSMIETVNLPSLTDAGVEAFRNCSSLTRIDLSKLRSFSDNLLQYCRNLVDFSASNATSMGNNVFRGCSSMTDMILPKVASIGKDPFHGCIQLESIELPSLTDFPDEIVGSLDNMLPKLKYLNLRSATQLYDKFFQGAENLKCVNLSGIEYEMVHVARLSWELPSECDVICKDGRIYTGRTEPSYKLKSEETTPPFGIVDPGPFYKTSGLKPSATEMTDIDLYDPLIGEVSENAFKDRKNIVKVYFPVAWEIGEAAFNGCSEIR